MNIERWLAEAKTIKGTGAKVDIPAVSENTVLHNVILFFFALAGTVTVLMIVIGGIRLVYSQGDPQNAAKARSTIIAAVIGLIIMLAAYAIIAYVTSFF